MTKNEHDEEVLENIIVDGSCIRTPDEDIVWAEKQKELEAEAAKGQKGKAPPKKKWLIDLLIIIMKPKTTKPIVPRSR